MKFPTAILLIGLAGWPAGALSQEVTLAYLQGATIEVYSIREQRIIQDRWVRYPEARTLGHITVGPRDTITTTFAAASVDEGHTWIGKPTTRTFALGKPQQTVSGDEVVWLFSNSSLVRLRAHGQGGSGAHKMTVILQRSRNGFQCAFSMEFAREEGKGATIRIQSRVDGTLVEVLDSKETFSSCRVISRT
jgi:hypothetical protein